MGIPPRLRGQRFWPGPLIMDAGYISALAGRAIPVWYSVVRSRWLSLVLRGLSGFLGGIGWGQIGVGVLWGAAGVTPECS